MGVLKFTGILMALLFLSAPATASSPPAGWHTPPDRWREPRNYHTPFDEDFATRIRISSDTSSRVHDEKEWSPNRAYWYSVAPPEFAAPGPWNTVIEISAERESVTAVSLLEHGNTLPCINWINEKLLYVEVWWGRAVGTCMIFDVETGDIIYREMVHWGLVEYEQWHGDIGDQP